MNYYPALLWRRIGYSSYLVVIAMTTSLPLDNCVYQIGGTQAHSQTLSRWGSAAWTSLGGSRGMLPQPWNFLSFTLLRLHLVASRGSSRCVSAKWYLYYGCEGCMGTEAQGRNVAQGLSAINPMHPSACDTTISYPVGTATMDTLERN